MDKNTLQRRKISRIIEAIDKRAFSFEYIDGNFFCTRELHSLLGLSKEVWADIVARRNSFIDFLYDNTMEIDTDEANVTKHIGIIDKNEKYIIINAFIENDDIYGFVVDKTAEVYNKFKMSDELQLVRQQSFTDSLTGLTNRAGFEGVVRKALLSKPNTGALAIIDMDNFKLVNDMLGHPEGDKVLIAFAEVLTKVVADTGSVVARLGGDEYVIFWSEKLTRSYLAEKLDELMKAVHDRFDPEYPDQHLSASIGAVLAETGMSDYESLYAGADKALYIVKENGKGHYVIK